MDTVRAGLYLHIPFCHRKCGYCDFYSITSLQHRGDFVSALLREIELSAPDYQHLKFDTIFLGGGTPTVLDPARIAEIMDALRRHFNISASGEFSIEANPGTVNPEILSALRQAGFNRLSLGVQSLHDEDLKFLGRIHSAADVFRNFEAARKAGFENINIDLMSAFPGLTRQRFSDTLHTTVNLQPEHISCYTLIFEPNTPFYTRMQRGKLQPVADDEEAAFFEMANRELEQAGYQAYEVSNFARGTENRCRHNLKYWDHEPYIGLGPSAHSFISGRRWRNSRSLGTYLKKIAGGRKPVAEEEILDTATLEFEYIFLHLRLKEGINLSDFQKRFGDNFIQKYESVIKPLAAADLLRQTESEVFLTGKGWLLADEVVRNF